MAKIKHTKSELKRQRDALKRFTRYLPTLELKKQQLQAEINRVRTARDRVAERERSLREDLQRWVAVFGEDAGIERLIRLRSVETTVGNIAGVDIPVFVRADIAVERYDLFATPLWLDAGIARIRDILCAAAERAVLERQEQLLAEELRITMQRVNLFEKVKIPEAAENIRVIQIVLGDEQTAGVVRGKIAKQLLQRKAATV